MKKITSSRAIIAGVITVIVLGAIFFTVHKNKRNSDVREGATTDASGLFDKFDKVKVKNDEALVDGVKFTLLSAKDRGKVLKEEERVSSTIYKGEPEAEGRFIEVSCKVHNLQSKRSTSIAQVIPNSFRIIDSKNNEYISEHRSQIQAWVAEGMWSVNEGSEIFASDQAETYDLFFDIPQDATGLKLKYSNGYDYKDGEKVEDAIFFDLKL